MRHVDEVVLLGTIGKEVANIVLDLMELNGALAPGPYVIFVNNSEVGAGEILVSQLQAGGEKPAASEADVEDGRALVLRQQVTQVVDGLQHLRLVLHFGP